MKMISNDLRSSCRSLLLGAYQSGGDTPKDEKWEYPSDWLTLPDPNENEAYLLVTNNRLLDQEFGHHLVFYISGSYWDFEIDWGDGTTSNFSSNHDYTFGNGQPLGENAEQYIVKITKTNTADNIGINQITHSVSAIGICAAKVHTSVLAYGISSGFFASGVRYVKFFGAPDKLYTSESFFAALYTLKKLEFEQELEIIPESFLNNCTGLTSISFPKAKTVRKNAFYAMYALQSAYLPMVEEEQGGLFSYCYNLKSIDLPKLTTYVYNSFASCNALKTASFSSLTALQQGFLMHCECLESVDIPSMTEFNGTDIFCGCYNLQRINMPSFTQFSTNNYRMGDQCPSLREIITTLDYSEYRELFFPDSYLI